MVRRVGGKIGTGTYSSLVCGRICHVNVACFGGGSGGDAIDGGGGAGIGIGIGIARGCCRRAGSLFCHVCGSQDGSRLLTSQKSLSDFAGCTAHDCRSGCRLRWTMHWTARIWPPQGTHLDNAGARDVASEGSGERITKLAKTALCRAVSPPPPPVHSVLPGRAGPKQTWNAALKSPAFPRCWSRASCSPSAAPSPVREMDRFVQRCSKAAKKQALVSAAGSRKCSPSPPPDRKAGGPPSKRPRLGEIRDSGDEDEDSPQSYASGEDAFEAPSLAKVRNLEADNVTGDAEQDDDGSPAPQSRTAFESSLAAVAMDGEVIEEYEAMRASQAPQDGADDAASRLDKRQWIRGKSSIYVDAFNLALDTVLADESHLFDDREKHVFEHWRGLSYEAQYLLVPPAVPSSASV